VHAGWRTSWLTGHLEPFFIFRVRLTLDSRRLFGHRRRASVAPTQLLLARPKTGEITAASRAAVRSGAAAEHHHRPARRMIILFAPGSQFLTIATGTAGIFPGSRRPYAGPPAASAAPAAEGVNSEKRPDFFPKVLLVRDPNIACSTFRTTKLHRNPLNSHLT